MLDKLWKEFRAEMQSVSELKYVAALLVLFAGIGGTIFARQLMSWQSSFAVTRVANSFAGGVFLGAALIHMLPDARENLESVFHNMRYPHFMLFGGIAFLLILLIDGGHTSTFQRCRERSSSQRHLSLPSCPAAFRPLGDHRCTGVALGLEQSLVGAIAILVAVLAHKSIAAMVLGISFEREKFDQHRGRILLWTFYAATPGGIALGTLLSNQLEGLTEAVVEGIFDAVAGGSFLYISVVDLLAEEFSGPYLGWLFLSAASGFSAMAVLAMWA